MFRLTYRDRYSNENSKSEFFDDIKGLGQALINIVNNEKEENDAMEWCGRATWGDKVVRNKFGYKIECFNETELKNNVENIVKEICNKLHCKYTYLGLDKEAMTFRVDIGVSWVKYTSNCEYCFLLSENTYPNGVNELVRVVDKDKDKFVKRVLESYDRVNRQMLSDFVKPTVHYNDLAREHAERFGIVDYRVKGRYMIYNQNYHNKEFIGKWVSKPCTYQRRVNLDTMEIETVKLKRLQKDGWANV